MSHRLGAAHRWWAIAVIVAAAAVGLIAGKDPKLAIPAVLAVGFVGIVLADLTAGLCLFTVVSFLDLLPTFGVPSLSLAKVFGLLLVVSWLATVATRRNIGKSLPSAHPMIAYTLLLFLLWALISLLWAESSSATLTSVARYAPNAFLFLIAYTAVRRRRHVRLVFAAFVTGAAFSAAYGLVTPGEVAGRVSGTVGDPNELAAVLVAALVLALGLWATTPRRSQAARVALAAAVVVCVAGIFLSLSRGGLVALGVAAVAAVVFGGRWRPATAGIAAVVAIAGLGYFALLASPSSRDRITTSNGGSGRVDLYMVAGRMVAAHPLIGVGSGNFPNASIHYLLEPGALERGQDVVDIQRPAHNVYLQILAELGIPGLLLLLAIIGASLTCAVRAARGFVAQGNVEMEILARALFVALAGILAADFFIPEEYSKQLWLLLALPPALLALARRDLRPGKFAPPAASAELTR